MMILKLTWGNKQNIFLVSTRIKQKLYVASKPYFYFWKTNRLRRNHMKFLCMLIWKFSIQLNFLFNSLTIPFIILHIFLLKETKISSFALILTDNEQKKRTCKMFASNYIYNYLKRQKKIQQTSFFFQYYCMRRLPF